MLISFQKIIFVIILLLLPILLLSQTVKFNTDSAYSYINHISVTIGPRPMGSQNENTALNWIKEKFDQFGADSTFIFKFFKVKSEKSSVNTKILVNRCWIRNTDYTSWFCKILYHYKDHC